MNEARLVNEKLLFLEQELEETRNKLGNYDIMKMLQKGLNTSEKKNSDTNEVFIQAVKDIETRSKRKFEIFSEKMKDFENDNFKMKQENLQIKQSLEIANKFTVDSKDEILIEMKKKFDQLTSKLNRELDLKKTQLERRFKTINPVEPRSDRDESVRRKTSRVRQESSTDRKSVNLEGFDKFKAEIVSKMLELDNKLKFFIK